MKMKSWSFTVLIVTAISSFSISPGHAVRVPLGTQQLAKPIKHHNITNLESVAAGYYYVTSLFPFVAKTWRGECFQQVSGFVTYTRDRLVGAIDVMPRNKISAFCRDYFQFKVGGQTIAEASFFVPLYTSSVHFDPTEQIRHQIRANGVAVYVWRSGLNQNEEAFNGLPDQSSRATNVINVDDVHSEDESYSSA